MSKSVRLLAVVAMLVGVSGGFAAARGWFERDRVPGDVGTAWGYPNYGAAPYTTRSAQRCDWLTARVRQGNKFVFRRVWRCW
jgi:hypothetical protein